MKKQLLTVTPLHNTPLTDEGQRSTPSLDPLHSGASRSFLLALAPLILVAMTAGCGSDKNARQTTPASTPIASQTARASEGRVEKPSDPELQKQIEQIVSGAHGHVGVAAVVLETGESVSLNARDHYPMQSVYKLPIAMAVMQKVDVGKLQLEQKVSVTKSDFVRAGQRSPIRDENPNGADLSVKDLLRYAISESDGTANDVLLRIAGGAEAVQAYLTDLKITEITVLNSEKEIGKNWQTQYQNWATPDGAVALLRALQERRGLSESSQALLLKVMIESTPGPKRLKGLLPATAIVAHKTGTSGTQKGVTAATNDIGLITLPDGHHLAIAVFVSDSAADEATREAVIAKVAKAVWDNVVGRRP